MMGKFVSANVLQEQLLIREHLNYFKTSTNRLIQRGFKDVLDLEAENFLFPVSCFREKETPPGVSR